jgi:hypothetical protein
MTWTDQVHPVESCDSLLMSLVKSTSISLEEGEETCKKKTFLSLKTIETWMVYVCHSEGDWEKQNI